MYRFNLNMYSSHEKLSHLLLIKIYINQSAEMLNLKGESIFEGIFTDT